MTIGQPRRRHEPRPGHQPRRTSHRIRDIPRYLEPLSVFSRQFAEEALRTTENCQLTTVSGDDRDRTGDPLLCKQGVVGSSPITSTTGVEMDRGANPFGRIAEKRQQSALVVSFETVTPEVSLSGGAAKFFGKVNQVLVRLWARLPHCLTGCLGIPAAEWVQRRELLCAERE